MLRNAIIGGLGAIGIGSLLWASKAQQEVQRLQDAWQAERTGRVTAENDVRLAKDEARQERLERQEAQQRESEWRERALRAEARLAEQERQEAE